jgi:alpha/beta superfamily hydrolase
MWQRNPISRRVPATLLALVLFGLLQACGSGGSADNAAGNGAIGNSPADRAAAETKAAVGSPTAVPLEAPASVALPAFTTVQTIATKDRVIRERVQYQSGALRINGLVCRPDSDGTYPILMYQHSGFGGLRGDWDGNGMCQYFASRGYAVFMSSYRGEDNSDGQIEYCGGEVDDAVQMLAIARTQPYVQARRAALLGVSHGGCVSLQMLARGVDVQVVVDLVGPTDWISLFDIAAARVAAGNATADEVSFLAVATATAGTPATKAAAFITRSPLFSIDKIKDWPGAMLVVHGGQDNVVPPVQSCAFVRGMGGFINSHLNWRYIPRWYEKTTTQHPSECGHPVMHWESGAHPGKNNWQGQRHFTFYDRMGHSDGFQIVWAIDDAEDFIRTKFPGH